MYRVALNVAIQQLRKGYKKPEEVNFTLDLQIAEPLETGKQEEKLQLLRQAISQLNEVEKAIIMLHFEERGNEEIAQIIGISQNYVRVKMNRIKEKLKSRLNPKGDGI